MRVAVIVLAFCLAASGAGAADLVRYVNTASSAGGDGTTNATAGDQRAYASLAEWEAAEQADLAAGGNTMTVHCEGSAADTTAVWISGWTTSSTNTITVQVDQDLRHDGKWDVTAYRLSKSNETVLGNYGQYVTIDGLQIEKTSSSANGQVCIWQYSGGGAVTVSNCILRQAGSGYREGGIVAADTADTINIYNCILYGGTGASGSGDDSGIYLRAHANLYNNTVNGFYIGINRNASGTVVAKNNLCNGAASSDFFGTFDASSDYNASSDATAPDNGNSRINQTFTFVTPGSDFHLDEADAGAKGFGTDLSGEGFSTDIDGEARGSTWDIGADDFGAEANVAAAMNYYRRLRSR